MTWLQHGLGVASAGLAFLLGRRFSPVAGRVAGGMIALSPVLVHYEAQLLYASGAVFLTAAFLLLLLRAMDRDTRAGEIAAGLVFSALLLLRTNAVVFLPVAIVALARRRGPVRSMVFAAASVALLIPVLLYNGIGGGAWTPFTVNGGMILATGFAEESLGGRAQARTPHDFGPGGSFHREAERDLGRSLTLAEASDHHRDSALRRIAERPGWAAALTLRKLRLLLSAREIDDNLGLPVVADRALTLRIWPAPWAFLLAAGLVGAALSLRAAGRARRDGGLLTFWLAAYGASLLIFFVNARYRLPMVVPLAVLSGVTIQHVLDRIRGRNLRAAAMLAGATAIVFAASLADPGVRANAVQARSAVGAALLRDGRPQDALDVLDGAVAAEPANAAARHNRAMTLRALGRPEEALRDAQRAVEADPGLVDAWKLRGTLLAGEGRMPEALESFRRAADLAPRDAGARSNVALALAALQRLDEAIVEGREAVRLGAEGLQERLEEWEAARSR